MRDQIAPQDPTPRAAADRSDAKLVEGDASPGEETTVVILTKPLRYALPLEQDVAQSGATQLEAKEI